MIKNDIELNTEIKRWTIFDSFTREFYDISDKAYNDGLKNNMIKMRGQFIKVEHGHKIWIDGIVLK